MPATDLTFSIVIPSYNEGDDVRISIESALAQDYPVAEILVVDDSQDHTASIVSEYAGRGVRLVEGQRQGCCEARNLGMRLATADVVVLLNADVGLPTDFLRRIRTHYDAGADFVLVEAQVLNADNHWARFIEMQHRYDSARLGGAALWSEGFSCRRDAAAAVGFIPGSFRRRFCRDWVFGKLLAERGYEKVIDRSIIVRHKAPDSLREYWRVRKARGRFSALGQCLLWRRPKLLLICKFLIKDLLALGAFALFVPAAIRVMRISRYSTRPWRDFGAFFCDYFVQRLALAVGEWEGVSMI